MNVSAASMPAMSSNISNRYFNTFPNTSTSYIDEQILSAPNVISDYEHPLRLNFNASTMFSSQGSDWLHEGEEDNSDMMSSMFLLLDFILCLVDYSVDVFLHGVCIFVYMSVFLANAVVVAFGIGIGVGLIMSGSIRSNNRSSPPTAMSSNNPSNPSSQVQTSFHEMNIPSQ